MCAIIFLGQGKNPLLLFPWRCLLFFFVFFFNWQLSILCLEFHLLIAHKDFSVQCSSLWSQGLGSSICHLICSLFSLVLILLSFIFLTSYLLRDNIPAFYLMFLLTFYSHIKPYSGNEYKQMSFCRKMCEKSSVEVQRRTFNHEPDKTNMLLNFQHLGDKLQVSIYKAEIVYNSGS